MHSAVYLDVNCEFIHLMSCRVNVNNALYVPGSIINKNEKMDLEFMFIT